MRKSSSDDSYFSVNLLMKLFKGIFPEAVPRRYSVKKAFVEILQNLRENTCARVSFFIKLQEACNFIKKKTLAQVLSCEFCEISKNTFSYGTQPVAASVFTDNLKLADDTPVFKKGDPFDKTNYRPVSVLPAISNIYGKLIQQQKKILYKFISLIIYLLTCVGYKRLQ